MFFRSGLSFSHRGFASTNEKEVNIRKGFSFAAQQSFLEVFQDLKKEFHESYGFSIYFFKTLKTKGVSLGLLATSPWISSKIHCTKKRSVPRKDWFLLLMDRELHLALRNMSLEEDTPIELPPEGNFNAFENNALSLIRQLLNPECQK